MRVAVSFLVCLFFLFLFPHIIQAHGSGPPYVKVNGEYAPSNILAQYYTNALPKDIKLGADTAPGKYSTGVPITFSIDEQAVPFSAGADNAGGIIYQWTYGDDSPPEIGTSVTHAYQISGTYIVTLRIKLPVAVDEYTTVDTIQLDVYPSPESSGPRAIISNHLKALDSNKDIITLDKSRTIQLDASKSMGNIGEYLWDFGDTATAKGKTVTHTYARDSLLPTIVLLRVIDANHIAHDTFVYVTITATPSAAAAKDGIFSSFFSALSQFFRHLFS